MTEILTFILGLACGLFKWWQETKLLRGKVEIMRASSKALHSIASALEAVNDNTLPPPHAQALSGTEKQVRNLAHILLTQKP